jgi:hypothetical protein
MKKLIASYGDCFAFLAGGFVKASDPTKELRAESGV